VSDLLQETITLDAVARRLAMTPEQTEQARVLLGGCDEAAVELVLRCCRQAMRMSEAPTMRGGVHAYNAWLIGTLVERDKAA